MNLVTRRQFVAGTGALATLGLASCGCSNSNNGQTESPAETQATTQVPLGIDAAAWQYNSTDDVYYQLSVTYCTKPADASYEQLAVFVPGAYFEATDNGNGTFTCKPSDAKGVGSYTATTAPIVMPINTPGYSAQKPLSTYQSMTAYTSQGFVYVHAGCRGRDAGAPAGIVDLKAAVRFLRASAASLAGNTERIFTFGMSGGGAQSALMGVTGNSALYDAYLTAIGAATGVSDAVFGSMDWCPVTGLDVGDEAYEWMMGATRSGLSSEDQAISDSLARAFAGYINASGFVDEGGAALSLEESETGIFQAGSYYQRVLQAVETSLNDFLADTTFPYEAPAGRGGGMQAGRIPQDMPQEDLEGATRGPRTEEEMITDPEDAMDGMGPAPDGSTPGARRGSGGPVGVVMLPKTGEDGTEVTDVAQNEDVAIEDVDNITRTTNEGGVAISGTYQTVEDYMAALNADEEWVVYDAATNTATITSVAAFCAALKRVSKGLGAFDQLDRGQGENTLFGIAGTPAHFDATLASILQQQGSAYAADYASDLQLTDAQGTTMQTRVNMYTPLYYLLATSEGFGSSEPAKHWRIRSGINQGDTALTTELNLALALKADNRVQSVDFAAVWGQGHTEAERTGTSEENFIAWVKGCQ